VLVLALAAPPADLALAEMQNAKWNGLLNGQVSLPVPLFLKVKYLFLMTADSWCVVGERSAGRVAAK
jgi:hypothetical protein